MKKIVLSIYDRKSASYGEPLLFENLDVAKRNLGVMIAKNPVILSHPEDFDVKIHSEYDFSIGEFIHCDSSVSSMKEFVGL